MWQRDASNYKHTLTLSTLRMPLSCHDWVSNATPLLFTVYTHTRFCTNIMWNDNHNKRKCHSHTHTHPLAALPLNNKQKHTHIRHDVENKINIDGPTAVSLRLSISHFTVTFARDDAFRSHCRYIERIVIVLYIIHVELYLMLKQKNVHRAQLNTFEQGLSLCVVLCKLLGKFYELERDKLSLHSPTGCDTVLYNNKCLHAATMTSHGNHRPKWHGKFSVLSFRTVNRWPGIVNQERKKSQNSRWFIPISL